MRIVVIGGYGAMGQIIVRDLIRSAPNAEIVIAGHDESKARTFVRALGGHPLSVAQVDVKDIRQTASILRGADVCVNAVQYELNETIMRACLLAKCHYLDLGGLFHMTKRQLKWHGKFKRKNLLAILGMGAAPGVTNILAKIAMDRLDSVREIHIRVGGKDLAPSNKPPVIYFQYSPKTVLEEHSVPPMIFEKGKYSAIPPRSLKTLEDFGGAVGSLPVMATLHSEVLTLPSYKPGVRVCTFQIAFPPDFEEKISFLVEAGFARPEAIDFTAKILSRIPRPSTKPHDLEILRARASGKKDGKEKTIVVDALFKSNPRWGAGAGDVDTGIPPSIVAQMLAKGLISARGVLPPEQCVPDKPFIHALKKRGMKLRVKIQ